MFAGKNLLRIFVMTMGEFEQFLLDHASDDTSRLLLGRAKWPSIDMDLAVHTIEGRRRILTKVPQWYGIPTLRYPTRLCTEQCSSAATARYKASLAARILAQSLTLSDTSHDTPSTQSETHTGGAKDRSCTGNAALDTVRGTEGRSCTGSSGFVSSGGTEGLNCTRRGRIADLTGGLGVDVWAFASVAAEVLHNEMDPALSEAVRHNFKVLGMENVTFRNACVEPGTKLPENAVPGAGQPSDSFVRNTIAKILDGFRPDLVFMDPARRASDGHKVFRLEDCQPDVLQLLPELAAHSRHLLLKISPMADISLIVKQLDSVAQHSSNSIKGMSVREVHVIGAEGECKELLLWLERGWTGACTLHVSEIHDAEGTASTLTFPLDAESFAMPVYAQTIGLADALLFEPGKALSKAGLFNTLSARFGLPKLSRHTHLYLLPPTPSWTTSEQFIRDESSERHEEPSLASICDFGKVFRILEVYELSGKTLKTIGKTWPQAEVTARDIPLSSDDLRRRLGVRSGGDSHIFGCRIAGNPRLLITRTIHP